MRPLLQLFLAGMLLLLSTAGVSAMKEHPDAQSEALLQVIRDISERYNVHFTYDREIVENVEIKKYEPDTYVNVEDALKNVLKDTKLKYVMLEMKYVIIYQDDPAGMKSLEQMVGVLQKIISQKKEKRLISVLDRLQSATDLSNVHLEKHRVVLNVSGTVTDQSGEPLIGVNIQVKGTNKGTATDFDGKFSLEDVNENATLVFSYVGYQTQEFVLNGRSNINITMVENTQMLDEVVVVGYGTQKKVNLTGAVSSVSANTLSTSSVPNSANLLNGRLPGVEVIQPSGKPGNDDPMIRIRGLGSYGASSSPLILIDGIIGSITSIAPNDIESVTVLKDAASASIYGARAANGVILVTTKKAKIGAATFEYNIDMGLQNATSVRELIWDSGEYMEMFNSARLRSGLTPTYTEDQVNDYKNAHGDPQYPNYNWPEQLFKSASVMNHSLSFSKGTEISKFRLGFNYSNQDGILPGFVSKRYTVNMNYENQISQSLRVGTIVNLYKRENTEPQGNSDTDLARAVYGRSPLATPFLPDGSGRKSSGRAYRAEPFSVFAPIAFSNGDIKNNNYSAKTQVYIIVDIIKGLQWETKGGFNVDYYFHKKHTFSTPNEFYFYQKFPGEDDYSLDLSVGSPISLGVTDLINFSTTPTIYSTLKYNSEVGAHEINGMVGYENQSNNYRQLSGTKLQFPNTSLAELNAGSPDGQSLGGTANAWALQSYFGRLAYNYDETYLLEGNLRYDGTSRVHPDHRWGAFPSLSAAWRISEERFIKNNFNWVDNLKFRASYGILGNQEIGLYPYQDIFSYANYTYGTEVNAGVRSLRMTDKSLTWEKTKTFDIGLDADVANGKFGVSFDYFNKNTYDILATLPVPASLGLAGPITNDGELLNTGVEIELRHRNNFGEFRYDANLQISGFKNELLSIVTPTKGVREVGLPYNSFYIYEWDGIFQSEEEVVNSADQIYNDPKPGDLKIKDQNGDGIVDADDRVSYSPFPKYYYSFNLNAAYKRFYVSIFFQGVEGSHVFLSNWNTFPFREGTPPKAEFRNAWTPENHSKTVPAIHEFSYAGVYGYPSTYILKDNSYLRLKNVQLLYTLPENLLNGVGLERVSVYVSGNNLLTFTKFTDGDPEVREGTTLTQFPQVRMFNIGLNVNF